VEGSLVQSLFGFLSDHIFTFIYGFAAIEIYLIFSLHQMIRKHELVLLDVSDNLLKGFRDSPDQNSNSGIHDRIQGTLEYISQKVTSSPETKKDFAKNANKISQKNLHGQHYRIETFASVMSTLVQVFPLLGILGTILAIAQNAFQNGGQLDAAAVSNAFVLAMDTTILGISFSIIFMVVESSYWPKIERVINESHTCKQIITQINMS
jgi:biopolymer transport protein ExbB/TolQ